MPRAITGLGSGCVASREAEAAPPRPEKGAAPAAGRQDVEAVRSVRRPRRSAFSPFDTRDRRHKLLNHETDAQKTAAESPEKFQKRDPASIFFESIDRRSF